VTQEDFSRASSTFQGLADSLVTFYADSMAAVADEWETSVDDASKEFVSSINDTLSTLKEDYAAYLRDHASRLECGASLVSHAASRGRDNGVNQASYGPTIVYHHTSGLTAGASTAWSSQGGSSPDVASLTAGYEFTSSDIVQGSVQYTHFWYSAASSRPGAVTNQEVSGMLAVTTTAVNLTGQITDDYTANGGSEVSIELTLARDLTLSGHLLGGDVKITPSAALTWGEQNEVLRQRRVIRAKKKNIVRISGTPDNTFGIMDYELALPVTLAIGNWNLVPTIAYVLPMNVLSSGTVLVKDPSTENGFLSVGVTFSLAVY
jgi:hypothetical protein